VARIINFWSFICALLCVAFFFIAFYHSSLLNINLCLAIILFFVSIAGFFGINNWTSALRSILTVVISGVLILVTGFIIFTGYLFSQHVHKKYNDEIMNRYGQELLQFTYSYANGVAVAEDF